MIYYALKIKWFIEDTFSLCKNLLMLQLYKRHLKMRIEKNNFGRREEW
tara:strand:- start:503 stop:646 length:144 start_codon:yes stop_codon:yes gene_type:complete